MAAMQPFLDYKFLLPEMQLGAGLTYYGSAMRLRQFVTALRTGNRPLNVGVVGGSVSRGMGARVHGVDDWFSIVGNYLRSTTGVNLTLHNRAVPGAPASHMELCVRDSVDPDLDLVFAEYTFDDGYVDRLLDNPIVATMERLLRLLLDLPSRPAVVLMHVPAVKHGAYEAFYATSEDLEGALSGYYNVPSLSARTALHQLAVIHPDPDFAWDRLYGEHSYPGNAGHKAIADLIVHLIQTTALDLLLDPPYAGGAAMLARPLPQPMYAGNLPAESSRCFEGERLQQLVVSAEGWGWVNEGNELKPRWGYVAQLPGSTLLLRINTTLPVPPPATTTAAAFPPPPSPGSGPGGLVELMIHYQASPLGVMGRAEVACVAGCACKPAQVDGWVSGTAGPAGGPAARRAGEALTQTVGLAVPAVPGCEVRVRLLEATSTKGHRFKVSGMVVADWSSLKVISKTYRGWARP